MYIEQFYLFIGFYFASILQVYTFCCVYFNMGANNFWTQPQVVAGFFFFFLHLWGGVFRRGRFQELKTQKTFISVKKEEETWHKLENKSACFFKDIHLFLVVECICTVLQLIKVRDLYEFVFFFNFLFNTLF